MFAPYLHSLIEQHGYWAVFVIILLECAGVPLPGETALILASVYAGATGNLDIVWVISLAAVAAIMGDNIGFWIGRRYGLPFVQRYGRLLHVSQTHLVVGQYLFAQHGAKVVFFGRFVAILRIFAALLAGVNRYSWRSFLYYNALGGLVWALSFGLSGYFIGDAFQSIASWIGLTGFILAVLGFVLVLGLMRRQEGKLYAAAQAYLDGQVAPLYGKGEGKGEDKTGSEPRG